MSARLALLIVGLIALIGAPAAGRPALRFQPDPSSVIAAEIALNRLVQAKGQGAAFREMAAQDAVLFTPGRVLAKDGLKGRAEPPAPVSRSVAIVYVSCDGGLAASTGSWKRTDGAVGYFTSLWRRDKKGRWQWIVDHGDTLNIPRAAPEFLTGKVATCKRRERPDGPLAGGRPGKGDLPPSTPDDSLVWSADVAPDGSRQVTVRIWTGTGYDVVIDDRVGAPA